jgi:signal transduction histidine kinase
MTRGTAPIRILLVDDAPANLAALRSVLARPDHELVEARSGAEALRFLLRNDCALILMDVQMPELDGFETAHLIRQNERTRTIPIVFLTAHGTEDLHVRKGYASGAIDYVSKPFDPELLRSKVAAFVALYAAQRQVLEQAEQLREAQRREHAHALAQLELRSLRRQEAAQRRYRTLVEGVTHAVVWIADPVTQVPKFSSPSVATILGRAAEDWLADPTPIGERVHAADRAAFAAAAAALAPGGEGVRLQHRMERPGGEVVWLDTALRLLPTEDGEGLELHGFSVDLTETLRAREALQDAVRLREDFLSIASHELRTPLSALALQMRLLDGVVSSGKLSLGSAEAADLRRRVQTGVRQVDRLTKLVNSLLDLARIRSGKLKLELERFDLCELVRDIAARYDATLAKASRALVLRAEAPVVGRWDRSRLDQLVTNLVTNAVKYGGHGPITVSAGVSDGRALLAVHDRGPGIPPHDLDRIFERFMQGSAASTGGLGLGLFISRKIAEAHGGAIRAESAVGEGSTFVVELPCELPQQAAAPDLGAAAS